jgi:hypothetical protein
MEAATKEGARKRDCREMETEEELLSERPQKKLHGWQGIAQKKSVQGHSDDEDERVPFEEMESASEEMERRRKRQQESYERKMLWREFRVLKDDLVLRNMFAIPGDKKVMKMKERMRQIQIELDSIGKQKEIDESKKRRIEIRRGEEWKSGDVFQNVDMERDSFHSLINEMQEWFVDEKNRMKERDVEYQQALERRKQEDLDLRRKWEKEKEDMLKKLQEELEKKTPDQRKMSLKVSSTDPCVISSDSEEIQAKPKKIVGVTPDSLTNKKLTRKFQKRRESNSFSFKEEPSDDFKSLSEIEDHLQSHISDVSGGMEMEKA